MTHSIQRAPRFTLCLAVLLATAFASDAFARGRMYNPESGRFMQRDPLGTTHDVRYRATQNPRELGGFLERETDRRRQYQDGMSLYQYVRSNPIALRDPLGLLTESEAKAEVQEKINEWNGKGWTLAANLMQHFLDKKGPSKYHYTDADIQHVKINSQPMVRRKTSLVLISTGTLGFFQYNEREAIVLIPPGNSANARWHPTSAMWAAYGGVQLRIQGVIDVAYTRDRHWTGNLSVNLRDFYNFKQYPVEDAAYKAARYLQEKCHYQPFWHDIWFKKDYSGRL